MKFYVSKYKIVTMWKYEDGKNTEEETIPAGTIFKINSMDNIGFQLEPVSKGINTGNMMSFTPEMLKIGFTESDYLPGFTRHNTKQHLTITKRKQQLIIKGSWRTTRRC